MSDDIKNIRRALGPTLKYVDGRIDVVNPGGAASALPSGGADGQVLTKQSSADGDADWETPSGGGSGLPNGGTTGQTLVKDTSTDGDASWQTRLYLPEAGSIAQVLTKDSGTDGDASWQNARYVPQGADPGQVLTATGESSYTWSDPTAGSVIPGGIAGQTLVKLSGTDGDADWGFLSPPGFPYIYIPTSPDSWDLDPALWTDPDLATNGWDIRAYNSPYAALTRVGEVDAGATNTGEYRSSLVRGQLWLQLHASTSDADIAVITKATSGNFTYKIDCWSSRFGVGFADANYNRCFAALFSGANPNVGETGVNTLLFGIDRTNGNAFLLTGASVSTIGSFTPDGSQLTNLKYADVTSSVATYWRQVSRLSGSTITSRSTAVATLGAVSYVGITLATSGGEYTYINAIRRLALGTFP